VANANANRAYIEIGNRGPTLNNQYIDLGFDASSQALGNSKLRIDSTGNVGIGITSPVNRLEVEGNASKTMAGGWLANSDRRIKTNIEPVADALGTLDRVRVHTFRYASAYRAAHPSIDDRMYMGVVAQEFAEVFPDHVKGSGEKLPDGSDEILQVDPWPLTVYSVAAIQDLHAQVRARDAQLAAQQTRLDQQDARLREALERLSQLEARINTEKTR
jgi:hypothetical protein